MNAKGFTYEVKESGRGEFHTYDVHRSAGGSSSVVVASYKWKFIAEQTANYLSGADERDEYVSTVIKS